MCEICNKTRSGHASSDNRVTQIYMHGESVGKVRRTSEKLYFVLSGCCVISSGNVDRGKRGHWSVNNIVISL